MGPLAVRPDAQGAGLGKEIVRTGVEWLRTSGASVIGLETMPRTMDNIGFYSGIGFLPGRLTLTLTLDAAPSDRAGVMLGRLPEGEQRECMQECRQLLEAEIPGYDFTREIEITERLALGDTLLLLEDSRLLGYALCHTVPLVEGRAREELRVLKLVLASEEHVEAMARLLADFARRSGTRRVALRVQGEYLGVYRRLVGMGARLRWTDLRMTADGYPEPRAARGVVLSNWEI